MKYVIKECGLISEVSSFQRLAAVALWVGRKPADFDNIYAYLVGQKRCPTQGCVLISEVYVSLCRGFHSVQIAAVQLI